MHLIGALLMHLSVIDFLSSDYYCEQGFSGGDWALVRRAAGNVWHEATYVLSINKV